MYIFITILILIAAICLILIVLVQNSKGGGLAAGFSSSNQVMGVRKTTDFLEKATWGLAITIIVLSILTAKFTVRRGTMPESQVEVEMPAPISPSTAPDVGGPSLPMPTQPAQQPDEPAE